MAPLEQVEKQWFDAFNKKDLRRLMGLYAEGCTYAQPHLPAPVKGKKAIEEDLAGFFTAFPDLQLKPTSKLIAGDMMAVEWTLTGTHQGPLVGAAGTIPPTNKKLTLHGAEFTRHNAEGLVVEERGYFDVASFMMQLGVMGVPASQ